MPKSRRRVSSDSSPVAEPGEPCGVDKAEAGKGTSSPRPKQRSASSSEMDQPPVEERPPVFPPPSASSFAAIANPADAMPRQISRRQERGGQENKSGQIGVNASNAENNSRMNVSNPTKLSTVKANERADEAADNTLSGVSEFSSQPTETTESQGSSKRIHNNCIISSTACTTARSKTCEDSMSFCVWNQSRQYRWGSYKVLSRKVCAGHRLLPPPFENLGNTIGKAVRVN